MNDNLNRSLMKDIFEAIREALAISQNKEERTAKIQGVLDLSHKLVLNEINHRLSTDSQLRDRSSAISYDVLTQGVKDNISEMIVLKFGRKEEDRTVSGVTFVFDKVLVLTKDRFVIEGYCRTSRTPISISKNKPPKIQIDYQWKEHKFYEAVYCANGTIRDKKELKLNSAGVSGFENVKIATDLIQFMTLCLYSIEDCNTTTQDQISIVENTI